jgi:hypothetical protein
MQPNSETVLNPIANAASNVFDALHPTTVRTALEGDVIGIATLHETNGTQLRPVPGP